jgi:GNAT superfamily N-acetyltransferase
MRTRTAAENEQALRAIVDGGGVPGLLAYRDGEAVGWCSVAPRDDYARFAARGGAEGVWLVVCLFVRASHRAQGVARALVDAAVAYAHEHGAAAVEGPPRDWRPDDAPGSLEAVLRAFRGLGFREVADSQAPGLMRKELT